MDQNMAKIDNKTSPRRATTVGLPTIQASPILEKTEEVISSSRMKNDLSSPVQNNNSFENDSPEINEIDPSINGTPISFDQSVEEN